jgi:hypothetical protein
MKKLEEGDGAEDDVEICYKAGSSGKQLVTHSQPHNVSFISPSQLPALHQ